VTAKANVPAGDDTDVLAVLATLAAGSGGTSYASWKESLRSAVSTDPFDALMVTVAGGAFLFYLAEKGKNPKVRSYVDALVFLSTCVSVGYADIFAVTPAGKAIASAVMTFGPALSGGIFDARREPERPAGDANAAADLLAIQRVIVDKLDAILGELKAR
jgi:voltage-gated potassium channel